MTIQNNEVERLKKQVFNLSCELDSIFDAYESLAYLACIADVDSKNVGVVIVGLNHRLGTLLSDLAVVYQRGDKDN